MRTRLRRLSRWVGIQNNVSFQYKNSSTHSQFLEELTLIGQLDDELPHLRATVRGSAIVTNGS